MGYNSSKKQRLKSHRRKAKTARVKKLREQLAKKKS